MRLLRDLGKLLCLLLLLATIRQPACAQFSNTIYQNLGTNLSTTGIPAVPITAITTGATSTRYTFTGPHPSPLLNGEFVILTGITGAGCSGLNGTVPITAFTATSPYTITTAQNSSGCTPMNTGQFGVFVTNIGQTQHNLIVIFTNAPAMTCTNPAATLVLLGSIDGSAVFVIRALTNNSGTISTLTAVGTYPYIAADLAAFDTTNCRAQVFYTGVLYPAPNIPDPVGFTLGDGTIGFGTICSLSAPFSFAMGATEIIAVSGTKTPRICHIDFSVSGPTDFKLSYGTGVNCNTGPTDLTGLYKGVITFSEDYGFSQVQAPAGKAVCINSSAAVTGGGIVTYARY